MAKGPSDEEVRHAEILARLDRIIAVLEDLLLHMKRMAPEVTPGP